MVVSKFASLLRGWRRFIRIGIGRSRGSKPIGQVRGEVNAMTTLVVGGGGFVGLNIVERLLADGRAVRILDMAPPPDAALRLLSDGPGHLDVIIGDVRDPSAITAAVAGVEQVVYGAAITAGDARDRDAPGATLDVNLSAYLHMLDAARQAGVRRVLNLSSAGAFGAAAFAGEGWLTEHDPAPDPRNIYAITKFASERVTDRMAEIWDIDAISVRLSGVFGRWERRTSVRDTPSPQFQILEALQAGRPALVERLDYRDWIYGPDVARAVLALLDQPNLEHRLYHISTGERWSVLDWGQALAARIGGICRLATAEETPNILLHATTDRRPLAIDRLQAATGFTPCFKIDQSVEDLVLWAATMGADHR